MTKQEIEKYSGKPLTTQQAQRIAIGAVGGALVGAVVEYPTKVKGAIYGSLVVSVVVFIFIYAKYRERKAELEDSIKRAEEMRNETPNSASPTGVMVNTGKL